MLGLQQLDSITFSNKLTTNFACSLSNDGRISLITESGVLIYTLMNYMDNIFSDIAFKKKLVSIPEFSLSRELEIDFENFYDQLSKEDLFERVLRLELTSKLEHSTPTELKPIAVEWSPKGLLGKSHCVLTILSNCHGLSILVDYLDSAGIEQYKCVCNVTKCIVKQNAKNWKNITKVNVDIRTKEWNNRVASTSPTAFVWSHIIDISNEIYAILFVAHPDGSISFWKFNRRNECDTSTNDLTFVGKCYTSLKNITAMHWKQTSENGGALCYGNSGGKLAVIASSNLTQENIIFEGEVIFNDENDEKRANRIISIEDNDYIYLITAREEFLQIFAIDNTGSVLDQVMIDLGNLSITGFCHYRDNILLVLTSGILKKLTLSMSSSSINIQEEIVPLKMDSTKFKTYGFVLSANRVYLGILVYPCRLKDITRDPTPSRFLIYHDSLISPFKTIMANTNEPLEKYWDCFEILRLISYKEKKFPWQGIDKDIDYDNLTLSQLKALRWIAKLSEKVYTVIPSITEYNIKPYILLHYLVTIKLVILRMNKLLKTVAAGKQLSDFQMRSLDVQNMFLKEMVLMKILEKSKVGEGFVDDIIETMEKANELEYPDMFPCFWCGEKITGPTCIPPHADSRCVISMMQIFFIPGFKCCFCKCVAHPEIAKEMDVVICPYCDIPMDQIYSTDKFETILSSVDVKLRENLEFVFKDDVPEKPFISTCDDCIMEQMSPEDIEDNNVNYLALTDSENEESLTEKINYIQSNFFDTNTITEPENPDQAGSSSIPESESHVGENSDYSFDDDSDAEQKLASKK